jgi:hypothetical protein
MMTTLLVRGGIDLHLLFEYYAIFMRAILWLFVLHMVTVVPYGLQGQNPIPIVTLKSRIEY